MDKTRHLAELERQILDSVHAIDSLRSLLPKIATACDLLTDTLRDGNKVLCAGNGGSAAEAMHMAEELIGRFRSNRPSLPGIALCSDGTALTCIGNDFGYDDVFRRQVEGLGRTGDLLVLFSTSGNAPNLLAAAELARALNLKILMILGRHGGKLAGLGDIELIVPGAATERIQEAHQVLLHLLLDAVENAFGGDGHD